MSIYTPGFGDEATWPACTGHPNDPRTEPMEDYEIEAIAETKAAEIIGGIATYCNVYHDPRERMIAEMAALRNAVRDLCSELAWKDYE
jgi:hypothetical protein